MDSNTATLLGGAPLTVTKRDGSSETITVRQLPIRLFPRLRDTMGDECAMVELYADRDGAWVDSLTGESHEAVISLGEELNRDFFTRWAGRVRTRQEQIIGETAPMLEAMQRANPKLLDSLVSKLASSTSQNT